MQMASCRVVAIALCVVVGIATAACADKEAQRGRKILEQHRAAVVTVQVVVKIKFRSQESETKIEATGTVIDGDGLTVLALSSIDPTSRFGGGAGQQFQMESEVTAMNLLLEDGTEVQSEVLLRDRDLDLAYLRPLEKPASPMPYVDLRNSSTAALLDNVVALNRLGYVANRVHSVAFERIEAVVEKPRVFYIAGDDPTSTSQGSPVFTQSGKLLGIFVLRTVRSTGTRSGSNAKVIIIPASDILEGALQAPGYTDEP